MALIVLLALIWICSIGGLIWGLPFSSFLNPANSFFTTLGVFNITMFIGIPLLMLIMVILRVFMRAHFRPKWTAGLWVFWLVNIVSLMFVAFTTVKEFSAPGEESSPDLTATFGNVDTLKVEMLDDPYQDVLIRFGNDISVTDNQLISKDIRLHFEKSKSDQFEISQSVVSRGRNLEEAHQLASEVDYRYKLEGNKLILPSYFLIPKGKKWRSQGVVIHVKVPEGKWVQRHENVSNFVGEVEQADDRRFSYWDSQYAWQMSKDGMVSPDFEKENQKVFSFQNFNKIRVEGAIKLNIRQGDKFEVRLENAEEYGDEIEVHQSGDILDISTDVDHGDEIVFEITMPNLEELWAKNSYDIYLSEFKLNRLRIVNEGNAQIKAFIDVDNLTIELTGDNELDIRGSGNKLKAILNDNARLDAEFFKVKTADVSAMNDSWMKVSATDSLFKKIDEHSELISKENPTVIE